MRPASDGSGEEIGRDLRPIGLWVFLATLTALLGASIIGYLVVRLRAEVWPPPGVPRAPATLWISTALLILGSLAIHHGVRALRQGRLARFRNAFTATLVLGLLFLLSQAVNGAELLAAVAGRPKELYTFTFMMLVVLHALHLLGGLVPLALVVRRALRDGYGPEDHVGPKLVAIYWHYLDFVWLLMCILLTI